MLERLSSTGWLLNRHGGCFAAPASRGSGDDDDVQPPRAVRAQQQRLLDVGRARRAGDEIDRARRRAGAVDGAQFHENAFVIADEVVGEHDDDVIVGQKASVVGLSGPETSARVPLSATAAKATLTASDSFPSEGPRKISSAVAPQGIAPRRTSPPMRRQRGQIVFA